MLEPVLTATAIGIATFAGLLVLLFRFYRKVEQGRALIINKLGDNVQVTFTGGIVIPIIYKSEIMDISVKAMEVERTGKNGLICEDNIRADIRVTFYVRVNKTEEDVLKVAQAVGCERASTQGTLEELFQAKFSEALKTVGKQMEFTTLFTERERFKEQIICVIGEDLNGYRLEDVAIDYLEQTPINSLDPDNILDAQGIRKIVDLTSREAMATNEFQRNKEKVIKQQDVEAREAVLELERQQADAEARQEREISTVRSREHAEAARVAEEERRKAEEARITVEEALAVAGENKLRQVEIAAKAKERTLAVEGERVERDRQLEEVERQRLVEMKRIEKEMALEGEKKKIQEIIRERVMVEKTVAEEQERIKDTVEIATAERTRKAAVIAAEQEGEAALVLETKAAEAKERAARSLHEESVTMAEARRVSAQKDAESRKTLAAAKIEEESAEGLGRVRVEEAEARAIELRGLAEAKAKTAGYDAEAEGIHKKAEAMRELDEAGRGHEEFKLGLEKDEKVQLASIDAGRLIAEAQAGILGEAMRHAKIDIVGGDGRFLETFFRSITVAKSVDEFVDRSDVVQAFTGPNGEKLPEQVKTMIGPNGISGDDVRNLTVSALLAKLATKTDDPGLREKAEQLRGTAKDMPLTELLALWLAK
jgi:uncharacterized membrane protein YqiK